MKILFPANLQDYELLDTGNGFRLERFGKFVLTRPEPEAIWEKSLPEDEWQKADAKFVKNTDSETGRWEKNSRMPERWSMKYENLSFWLKLTPFKHTGLFPEQATHWDWLAQKIKGAKKPLKILNLFGYTGAASLVAAQNGAQVVHVDASRPAVSWARENQQLSGLTAAPIRWIVDDAVKFVQREIRRGQLYDGILMDPPAFGHGPNRQVWKFSSSFPKLLHYCREIFITQPVLLIVNAYAISSSFLMLENVMKQYTKSWGGVLESGELALREKSEQKLLSTGIFTRWCDK